MLDLLQPCLMPAIDPCRCDSQDSAAHRLEGVIHAAGGGLFGALSPLARASPATLNREASASPVRRTTVGSWLALDDDARRREGSI
jgi:hypothetical protein